jgi:hypothetical protein
MDEDTKRRLEFLAMSFFLANKYGISISGHGKIDSAYISSSTMSAMFCIENERWRFIS